MKSADQHVADFMDRCITEYSYDGLIVGLSGGADSVCLLDCLVKWKQGKQGKQGKLSLLAVHVHHGIRGEEADRDEVFCRQLCEARDIEYRSYFYDVPTIAQKEHLSCEEAGRKVRYQVFSEAALSIGLQKPAIVVAHHRDDQAETVLFHLCRGSNLRGLCGIRPIQEGVLRPLLKVSRKEIEAYCEEHRLEYCKDSTNDENTYARNVIRNRVLPLLAEDVNEASAAHIAQTADALSEAEAYLSKVTEEVFQRSVKWLSKKDCQRSVQEPSEEGCVVSGLEDEDSYIAGRVLYRVIVECIGGAKDVTGRHVDRAKHLLRPMVACGTSEEIFHGLVARKETDGIYFFFASATAHTSPLGSLRCTLLSDFDMQNISNEPYTKYMDYDKICGDLRLKTWEEADDIVMDDFGHHKKLNRYFIDRKLPARLRKQIPIVADDTHVVWIVGERMGNDVKLTKDTKRVLKVEFLTGREVTEEGNGTH